MTEISIAIGDRIKYLRKQHMWTQEQLAEFADLHVSYVIALEKGRKNASLDVIYRIACAFGMTLSSFFEFNLPPVVSSCISEQAELERRIEPLLREYTQKLLREIKDKEP